MDGKQKFAATNKQDSSRGNGSTQPIPRSNSAALEEIWRAHARPILRITQRITNNREDAEDALQDCFLRAHVHLHDFDGRSSMATWLTRIAINSALMILRKRGGTAQVSIENAGLHGTDIVGADQMPSPEEQYADREVRAIVRSEIGTLRPSIRRALELQTLKERSVKEIAESLSLSVPAAKSRIFHARAALRRSLGAKFVRRSIATKAVQQPAA